MSDHIPDEGQQIRVYQPTQRTVVDPVKMVAVPLCPTSAVGFDGWSPATGQRNEHRTQRHRFPDSIGGDLRVVLAVLGVPVCRIADRVSELLLLFLSEL